MQGPDGWGLPRGGDGSLALVFLPWTARSGKVTSLSLFSSANHHSAVSSLAVPLLWWDPL